MKSEKEEKKKKWMKNFNIYINIPKLIKILK